MTRAFCSRMATLLEVCLVFNMKQLRLREKTELATSPPTSECSIYLNTLFPALGWQGGAGLNLELDSLPCVHCLHGHHGTLSLSLLSFFAASSPLGKKMALQLHSYIVM